METDLRVTVSAFELAIESVGFRIRRCQQIAVALFNDEVGTYGVTPIQYGALAAIAAHDDLDATRLASLLAFDRSTVGAVLERLEVKGLIERESHLYDKRAKRLRATAAGRTLLDDVDEHVRRSQRRILGVLDRDERETFMKLLEAVITRHAQDDEAL